MSYVRLKENGAQCPGPFGWTMVTSLDASTHGLPSLRLTTGDATRGETAARISGDEISGGELRRHDEISLGVFARCGVRRPVEKGLRSLPGVVERIQGEVQAERLAA